MALREGPKNSEENIPTNQLVLKTSSGFGESILLSSQESMLSSAVNSSTIPEDIFSTTLNSGDFPSLILERSSLISEESGFPTKL